MLVKRDFFVDFRSVDSELNIKNSGILGMFEDMACIHGNSCGEDISTSDLRWLLAGYRVNILRRPRYGDEVQVITWSKDYRNVTATREFEMRTADGELLVTGWSNWARVNIKTKELVRLTDEHMAPYQSEPERTNFGKAPRINEPASHDSRTDMVIDWRWMDNNRHMHNSYYLDVAEHILPDSARAQLAEYSFDVAYKQEIPENASVACLLTANEDGWTVTFKSSDLATLHAVVIFRRLSADEAAALAQSAPQTAPEASPKAPAKRRSIFGRKSK